MTIKGIIFDFGFTLFYFENPSVERYYECFNRGLIKAVELLKEKRILTNQAIIQKFLNIFKRKRVKFFKKSIETKNEFTTTFIFQDILDSMYQKELIKDYDNSDEKLFIELADLYHSCELEEWVPFIYVKNTLEQLSKIKGLKLAVLSNHPHHNSIINLLEKYDMVNLFDVIVTSAEFGKRKPSPEIFFYTLKKMGLMDSPESCYMCGDEHADIIGGYKAGLKTILCERVYKFPYEKEINVPNIIKIGDIREIIKYVEK